MTHRDWLFEVVEAERIVDGDTYWLRLDVGFRQWQLTPIRLLGHDTAELYRPQSDAELDAARDATAYVTDWFTNRLADPTCSVWARTERDPDSFGRWLADIWAEWPDGETRHLGQSLRDIGLAATWPHRWREVYGEDQQ